MVKTHVYPKCKRCGEDITRQHIYLVICEACLVDIRTRLFEPIQRGELIMWSDQDIENWYNELKKK